MAESVLALRIDAPMQSWGVRSRFTYRETATEPTKSGIVGLLGAALGVERTDERRIRELADLRMAVRVEREGILERDYQVTGNVPTTKGAGHRNVVSHRYYLADALFLVLLAGPEGLLGELRRAVLHPRWPLFFGRRSYVPASPLILSSEQREKKGTGLFLGRGIDEVLRTHPWQETRSDLRADVRSVPWLRTVVDASPEDHRDAEPRYDVPVVFTSGHREFRQRYVRVGKVPVPSLERAEG